MQTIATATSGEIEQRKLQIVLTQKPIESRPGLSAPTAVPGHSIGLQACGDCACRFHRLLIEARLLTTFGIKAVGPNRCEMTIAPAVLHAHEPVQRFEPGRDHPPVGEACAC